MTLNIQKRLTDDFYLLYQNKTLLRAVYLATNAVDDLHRSPHLSSRTQQLLCTILASLNHDLHQATGQQSSLTMMIILVLLFAAEALQDSEAIVSHLDGVRRLLMIRNHALTTLDAKLVFKIQQVDLRLALASGQSLRLTLDDTVTQGLSATPIVLLEPVQKLSVHSPVVIEAFERLQALTQHIKDAMRTRTDLKWEAFQSQINNIQMQLLQPKNSCISDNDDALRLGMLAFLTTLSRSPIRRPDLPELHMQFEESFIKLRSCGEAHRTFVTWVMMMGFLSVIETSNPLVGVLWDEIADCDLSWEVMRERIRAEKLPWIGFVHDGQAKSVFIYLQAQRARSGHIE
ncbi:hypothetical protein FLONG3_4006 [Fusarium longipes]|uniref:Uncharacterized protein n=1 Tax=Fusarium longipes TaxID=694270 RepID=A0A395SZI9_9HYPO|nr:hypothetical protein FLONG3_4006 [Fusarium longipes]